MPAHVEFARARLRAVMATEAGKWGAKVGRQVTNAAKARCPVDEGRLRSSITHTVTVLPSSVRVRIGSPLEYAEYVHRGTGIYGPRHAPIVPVSAKALKFEPGRRMGPLPAGARNPARGRRGIVFARSVKGSPPNPFLADALEEVLPAGSVRRRR
jgi:hypothetical protein